MNEFQIKSIPEIKLPTGTIGYTPIQDKNDASIFDLPSEVITVIDGKEVVGITNKSPSQVKSKGMSLDNLFQEEISQESTISQEEAEVYSAGEEIINGPYATATSNPPQYIDNDGKKYDSIEELKEARRKRYEEEHPEYAQAREKCEEALNDYNSFLEKEMAKWDEENGYTPQGNTLQYRFIDEERKAYMKALQDAYREANPSYDILCNLMNLEHGPKIKLLKY